MRAKKTKSKTKRKAKKRGARTLISRERIQKISGLIRAGNYADVAAQASGISESSFYGWLERGQKELDRLIELETKTGKAAKPRESEALFLEFLEEIRLSNSEIEVEVVGKVIKGLDDPDVAMRFLGLRFKKRWSKLQKHELTGADGQDLVPVVVYLPDNGRDKKS
jgi:transposase